MQKYIKQQTVTSLMIIFMLVISPLSWGDCPSDLTDRADVVTNPPGNDYDVYYNRATSCSGGGDDFLPAGAQFVSDALLTTHNILVGPTYNFNNPFFSDTPNDTCIFDSANIGTAPEDKITIDSPSLCTSTEPFIRMVTAHELFHHVQYSYIDFDDWPSWGGWTVEGTARLMEDKLTLDNDTTPMNTLYVGEINDYLSNPNRTLMNISYTSALFWNYLTEQLGTPFPEPARGVDVIQRFWNFTSGNSPDSVRYLRDTINSFISGVTLEDMFRDFGIANYTHDLDVSALPNLNRYLYFDESPAGGNTPYNAVARQAVTAANTVLSSDVVRWGARYFEVDVPSEKQCEAIGFWGQAKDSKNLSWALIGIKNGDQVTDIYRATGNTFYRSVINPPDGVYDKLALAVMGLNNSAGFDYAFGWGPVSGEIRLPTLSRMAFVGTRDDPERFQVRLRMTGPAVLTPPGLDNPSIKGLDTSLFTVILKSVATGAEYDATIVNASYVSGEYWLVVQAPEIANAADGDLYDLIICFCTRSGACTSTLTSAKSVLYAKITRNQMLVLDRSFSMHYPTSDPKIAAAKNAARLYVNAAADDDRLGLVTFNGNDSECDDDSVVNFGLSNVAGNRAGLISAVDAVVEDGWTSIGDGLKDGRDQLLGAAADTDLRSIVLLSDGLENEGDFWAANNSACATPPVRNSFDPATGFASDMLIDTVAFGSDADQALLQNIAVFTGGDYYYVSTDPASSPPPTWYQEDNEARASSLAAPPPSPTSLEVPNRLANIYRSIEEDIHGQDRLFYRADALSAAVAVNFTIPVTEKEGGGIRDALFAFNWDNDAASMRIMLNDPDGNPITSGIAGWLILNNQTNKTYQFSGVLPAGNWQVRMESQKDAEAITMLSGKIVRGVDMDLYFSQVRGLPPEPKCDRNPLYAYLRGLPVTILVNINDAKAGIAGLGLEATIQNPDGSSNQVSLFDDGNHGDGLPGDGIYGNDDTRTPFFSTGGVPDFPDGPPTGQVGSYTVVVDAVGESNFGEKFQRNETRSFQVFEYGKQSECRPDLDEDQLPDRWEDLYGLDKTNPSDAGDDNDGDGLRNKDEFFFGTLPFNPDTDAGGESDGSEVKHGRDPLYDKDDLLPAIIDYGIVSQRSDLPVHLPEPETNILHFPVNANYQLMQIWRTDPSWTGFRIVDRVDLVADPSGVYYDKGLRNGFTYSYYLVAEGLSNAETAPTENFTGTPKADPLPPKGWIRINGGAPRTNSLNVRVQLDTSDDAKEVQVSEDPTFSGVPWKPLLAEIPFVLKDAGTDPFIATVYAKFRDAAQNESIVYHDTIKVDRICEADRDGDKDVDAVDLWILLDEYPRPDCSVGPPCKADINIDGIVDEVDIQLFAEEYGRIDCK